MSGSAPRDSVTTERGVTTRHREFVGMSSKSLASSVKCIRDASGDYVLRTPVEFQHDALPGTTLSYTIRANTMDYGQTYSADAIFSKMLEGKEVYPEIRNGVASVHTTTFQITTIPGSAESRMTSLCATISPSCSALRTASRK